MRASTAEMFSLKPMVQSIFSLVADARSILDKEPMMDSFYEEMGHRIGRDVRKEVEETLRKRRHSRYFRDRLQKILDVGFLSGQQVIFVSDKDDMPDLALRLYNNLNLVNQDGAFFMNTHPFSSLEEVLEGVTIQSADGAEERVITCLDINRRFLPLIARELEAAHVTHDAVFPDPYKISQEIGRKALRL